MKNILKLTIMALAFAMFASCDMIKGDEVVRIEVDKLSDGEVQRAGYGSVTIEDSTTFEIWSEMDLEYQGNVQFEYLVVVFQNDSALFHSRIDPMDKPLTVGESKSVINGTTKWSFSGKNGELNLYSPGTYDIAVKLFASNNDGVKVNNADLVLR